MHISIASLATSFATLLSMSSVVQGQVQYTINPDSVSETVRGRQKHPYHFSSPNMRLTFLTTDGWCSSQVYQCPLICLQLPGVTTSETQLNSCDPSNLSYGCVCANGASPNVTEFSLTLPYYVCQEWTGQCVTGCGQDSQCAYSCRADHPCGATKPTLTNTTSSASAATATTTPTGGLILNDLSNAAKSAAAPRNMNMFHVGHAYGGLLLASALVGGFALLL